LLIESRNTGLITRHTPTSGTKFDYLKNLLKVSSFILVANNIVSTRVTSGILN
jgi:hypothetical protein